MTHDSADFGEALDPNVATFSQAIDECFRLYRESAQDWVQNSATDNAASDSAATLALMDDLARGLMIKVFLTIVEADRRFSEQERRLAQVLITKLWGRSLLAHETGAVLQELLPMSDKFDWYQLVRPFAVVPALHGRVSQVETVVMRFGNLVAKADGTLAPEEAVQLKGLLAEISRHLRAVPLDNDEAELARGPHCQEIRRVMDAMPATGSRDDQPAHDIASASSAKRAATEEERLRAALQSLDDLIGLEDIKNEVRELARFLRVQRQREQARLPRTQVSLHTVFAGNPGTGKTSVARILGEIFGALGIVARGHLIETDRSGLVAGYAGQTAERAHKIIDKALDGVLFIDEAYSLVSDQGEDPFGHEALEVLLKRMEDNRDRLVVVLAGYPQEMDRLLATNPGLASRFQRTFDFPDFGVVELCRIFQAQCEKK